MTNYPTAWQRRALWTATTAFALVGAGVLAVWLLREFGRAMSFLQPVLIPFAVAAILAFLLDPVVRFVVNRTRLSRKIAVLLVFAFLALLVSLLLISVVPRLYASTARMVHDLPAYTQRAQERLLHLVDETQRRIDRIANALPGPKLEPSAPPAEPAGEAETALPPGMGENRDPAASPPPEEPSDIRGLIQRQLPELQKRAPALANTAWRFFLGSVGGVLGGFGTLLNAIIIPIYLYFMLSEGPEIAMRWKDYVPLRNSPVKTEVVSVLTEVNGYLVAFFRGQLLVCVIDGVLVGTALAIVGLDFAFLIGLLVIVLTIIPYLGIVLCYIPVILIAIIQYGDWQHPSIVVAVMFTVQTLEGYLIAPKIVGESTGLHPLTVIVSVFFWSLLLDGPIGAILAVPLTATLKVLARRYVWERARRTSRLVPAEESTPVLEAGGMGAMAPAGPMAPATARAD